MHRTLQTTHFLREAVARAEALAETAPPLPAALQQLLDAARVAVSVLDHVVMTAVDLAVTCNADGIITFVSDTAERLLGYTPAEATGRNMVNFVHPDDYGPLLSTLSTVAGGGSAQRIQARHFHKDGHLVWLEWRGSTLPGGQGLSAFARDVTPYKQYERLIRESEMLFHALFDLSPDGVFSLDREGLFVTTNPACSKITGHDREAMVGRHFATIVVPDSVPHLHRIFEAAVAGETQDTEAFVMHKDGHTVALHITAVPLVVDDEVVGIYGVARDITERKQSEARLAHLAYHDPLTGLANRTLFMNRLEQAMARNTTNQPSLAVLYLDLDDFKIVNDSLGHRAGDMLLVEAAERLRACVGAQATVARLGGDEFTVLLEGTADTDDAIWVTLKVLQELKAPYMVDGHKVVVTPSVGVVMGNQGQDAKEVLRYADIAMYRAKQNGKARYEAFSPVMYDQVMQRLKLETDLRLALERDEFRLWYQPVVDMKTGDIVTVEALVRWEHPERGMVSPAEFIPLAEETGLILTLGSWVLEEACRQARAWQELHRGLVVSVNLSARQFQEPFLADVVGAVLERAGLDPHLLQLEITETVLMTDGASTQDTLRDLKQLGIQLAMDDFGTGYSSLSYLKRFPIDVLKIDRSFVSGLGESPEDTTLVETVIMLARALGLSVTAEGVETEDQAERLRGMGCDFAQGYLFARPLPAAKVQAQLRSRP